MNADRALAMPPCPRTRIIGLGHPASALGRVKPPVILFSPLPPWRKAVIDGGPLRPVVAITPAGDIGTDIEPASEAVE